MNESSPEQGTMTHICCVCGIILKVETGTRMEGVSHGFCAGCFHISYDEPHNQFERTMMRQALRVKLKTLLQTRSLNDPLTMRGMQFLTNRLRELK